MALCQGEIISNLIQPVPIFNASPTEDDASPYEVDEKIHPWAIIMSQDCDLAQDYRAAQSCRNQGTILPNILFCEIKTAEEELADIARSDARAAQSQKWKRICQNIEGRFHFLERVAPEHDAVAEGLQEFVIDFKRYFTLPPQEVYRQLDRGEAKKRSVLHSPYLEHLAHRFHAFQSRVALDEDHSSE